MIRCEEYDVHTKSIVQLDSEKISHPTEREGLLWIDIEAPTDAELLWVEDLFTFHPLAMEDVRKQQQRVKLDEYRDYHFFVVQSLSYHPDTLQIDTTEVDLFVGKNYVVSIHRVMIPALEHARQLWHRATLPAEATSYLFYLLSDAIVDSYFPIIDDIGERIDELDERIFAKPEATTLKRVFALRKTLLTVRKTLGPLRDAFNELIRSGEVGTIFPVEHTRAYYSDVYDHILRLTDFVDTYRDMLSGTLDAYQSSMSNRLNENMQRFTVAATILATSTVITGFFGMNVQGLMINTRWVYSGHAILAVLLLVTAIEVWIFHRKGWI